MEIEYVKGNISIRKELLSLDNFVLAFIELLDKSSIDYVIVSGYVGIFFGRSRNTEDVDILIERCDSKKIPGILSLTMQKFECMNAKNQEDAYKEYLSNDSSLRFYEKNNFIPNMELKFVKMILTS